MTNLQEKDNPKEEKPNEDKNQIIDKPTKEKPNYRQNLQRRELPNKLNLR